MSSTIRTGSFLCKVTPAMPTWGVSQEWATPEAGPCQGPSSDLTRKRNPDCSCTAARTVPEPSSCLDASDENVYEPQDEAPRYSPCTEGCSPCNGPRRARHGLGPHDHPLALQHPVTPRASPPRITNAPASDRVAYCSCLSLLLSLSLSLSHTPHSSGC